MFDVFQNVLFGKKKSNADSEKEKSDADDFVVLGQTSNEQAVKEADNNLTDFPFPVSFASFFFFSSFIIKYYLLILMINSLTNWF